MEDTVFHFGKDVLDPGFFGLDLSSFLVLPDIRVRKQGI